MTACHYFALTIHDNKYESDPLLDNILVSSATPSKNMFGTILDSGSGQNI